MARPTSYLWSPHYLLQALRLVAQAGVRDKITDAPAAGHDAAVQMIDTSVRRCTSTERVQRATITEIWAVRAVP